MTTTLNVEFNRSAFDSSEVAIVEKAIETGQYEHIAAMLYEVTPEKAAEIEKIQRQLRPRDFQFESKTQAEFEKWLAENGNNITPEIEAEFQRKINAEREAALHALTGGVSEATITKLDNQKGTQIQLSNSLEGIRGLGANSIKRLKEVGVLSVDDFRKLSQEKRVKILGPLVAHKLKDLTL